MSGDFGSATVKATHLAMIQLETNGIDDSASESRERKKTELQQIFSELKIEPFSVLFPYRERSSLE